MGYVGAKAAIFMPQLWICKVDTSFASSTGGQFALGSLPIVGDLLKQARLKLQAVCQVSERV
jgi:hypothetical protein